MSQSSITECNTALDARNALSNGKLVQIKSGAEPDIDGAQSGTVLVQFTLGTPAFGNAANRIASLNIPAATTALADGTGAPYHYIVLDGATVLRSGTAGTSGTDMILNQATWSTGDDVSITAWTTTQPK